MEYGKIIINCELRLWQWPFFKVVSCLEELKWKHKRPQSGQPCS